MSLVVLVVLVLVLAGIGMALATQARQAGRTSHWFYHAQIAHNLADGALKFAYQELVRNNGAGAKSDPAIAAAMTKALEAVKAGVRAKVPLFSSSGTLPAAVARLLAPLPDFAPAVSVSLEVLDSTPLWTGDLEGIPATPGERLGRVQISANARVQTPTGVAVERTILLEKQYKVVCPLPALLGRFALFVADNGAADPNGVSMKFEPTTGDASYGAARALEVRSTVAVPLVKPGDNKLDRAAFVAALGGPKFLDRQGWVYLGGAKPWTLNLAHGYGEGGESPYLRGTRDRTLIRGSKAEDAAFCDRYHAAVEGGNGATCVPYFTNDTEGAYLFHHGFASNYEIIGLETSQFRAVQQGGQRIKMKYPNSDTASLRLMGSAAQASPTLVFGAVYRAYLQRLALKQYMGPVKWCHAPGVVTLPFFKLEEHGNALRRILTAAFGSEAEYRRWGSTLRDDELWVQGLNTALDVANPGLYDTNGVLKRSPATGGGAPFTSDLLPWLGALPGKDGIPIAALSKLANGELDSPKVYRGKLAAGLAAFLKVVQKRATFSLKPEAVRKRVLVNKVLKLPGVAVVDEKAELEIGEVTKVQEGGMLVTQGPLRITGNIARGGKEPLTLVSLSGGITVASSVTAVDAHLVALDGAVKLDGACTVAGLAGRELDLSVMTRAPGARAVVHGPDMDPTGPQGDLLRVYYGGQDRLAVSGAAQ